MGWNTLGYRDWWDDCGKHPCKRRCHFIGKCSPHLKESLYLLQYREINMEPNNGALEDDRHFNWVMFRFQPLYNFQGCRIGCTSLRVVEIIGTDAGTVELEAEWLNEFAEKMLLKSWNGCSDVHVCVDLFVQNKILYVELDGSRRKKKTKCIVNTDHYSLVHYPSAHYI